MWKGKIVRTKTDNNVQSWFGGVQEMKHNVVYRVKEAHKQYKGEDYRLLLYPVNSDKAEDSVVVLASQVKIAE